MSGVCYDFEKWSIVSLASVAITLITGRVGYVTILKNGVSCHWLV